jgi:hypothetical protein
MFPFFVSTDCFVETCLATDRFGASIPNSGCWSTAGIRFDEMFATLLPVGSWWPTAAMEQADPNSLRPDALSGCSSSNTLYLHRIVALVGNGWPF